LFFPLKRSQSGIVDCGPVWRAHAQPQFALVEADFDVDALCSSS